MPKKLLILLIALLAGFYAWRAFFLLPNVKHVEVNKPVVVPVIYPAKDRVHPTVIKALYMTAQSASLGSRVKEFEDLLKTKELNAIVLNIKDGGGSYFLPYMQKFVTRMTDLGVYMIARIAVFQDDEFAKAHPEVALKNPDGTLWRDHGGYKWVDPANRDVWDHNVDIALRAFRFGFDEVNFDYIRFPSDGVTEDMVYPTYSASSTKASVMRNFYQHLTSHIKRAYPQAILSADLFAYTFLREDDLGIGQRFPVAASYFDIIAPMIYPSHYSSGNFNFQNPDAEPYQVVRQTLEAGEKQLQTAQKKVIIRPWIQAFTLGVVTYTPQMIREQMRAIEDVGLKNGWMLWNASNHYSPDIFLPK